MLLHLSHLFHRPDNRAPPPATSATEALD